MGLLDVLNGMQNGPRGANRGGGMSPLTMALLGLHQSLFRYAPCARCDGGAYHSGGGLGDMLRNIFGGTGGRRLGRHAFGWARRSPETVPGCGQGRRRQNWVSTGQNQPIAAHELAKVLTPEQIEFLTERTGL
jgi:YidB-like protein